MGYTLLVELALGDADGLQRIAAGRRPKERKGELIHVVILV
jgi:hypothetical protein